MKKIFIKLLCFPIIASIFAGCVTLTQNHNTNADSEPSTVTNTESTETISILPPPKYIFLFIGDGMSNSQIQATSDFLTVLDEKDHYPASLNDNKNSFSKNPHSLNFINFKATGSATTYDKTSSAPDSASAATAIATGHKTISGTLNMDETGTQSFETITQKVHRQLGMKVGIISSVNLNHATPAAFYAHQAKRSNYYEIGLELVSSGFEYFAGGALRRSNGYDNVYPQKNLLSEI